MLVFFLLIQVCQNVTINFQNNITIQANSYFKMDAHIYLKQFYESDEFRSDLGILSVIYSLHNLNTGDQNYFDVFVLDDNDQECYYESIAYKKFIGNCNFLQNKNQTFLDISSWHMDIDSNEENKKNYLSSFRNFTIIVDNTQFPKQGAYTNSSIEACQHVQVQIQESYFYRNVTQTIAVIAGALILFLSWQLQFYYFKYRKNNFKNKQLKLKFDKKLQKNENDINNINEIY